MFVCLEDRLEEVQHIEISSCPHDIELAFKMIDHLTAKATVALASFDAAGTYLEDGSTSTRAWLARNTPLGVAAGPVASCAKALRTLAVTASAWIAGDLSGSQVRTIVTTVGERHLSRFAAHEAEVVPLLVGMSVKHTHQVMARWRSHADSDTDAEPRPAAGISLSELPDGWRLDGELDARGGRVLHEALQAIARPPEDGDVRTPTQRRGDGLVEIAEFFLDHHDTQARPRNLASMVTVVDVSALSETHLHGETLDGRTVTASVLEATACDAEIIRLVTAGRSRVLDVGRRTRLVSDAVFLAVAQRDKGCRHPGCTHPVAWCHAHHVHHWRHGGRTTPTNLALFCSRHHHLIHRPGWHLELEPDGTITFTTPAGTTLTSCPPP